MNLSISVSVSNCDRVYDNFCLDSTLRERGYECNLWAPSVICWYVESVWPIPCRGIACHQRFQIQRGRWWKIRLGQVISNGCSRFVFDIWNDFLMTYHSWMLTLSLYSWRLAGSDPRTDGDSEFRLLWHLPFLPFRTYFHRLWLGTICSRDRWRRCPIVRWKRQTIATWKSYLRSVASRIVWRRGHQLFASRIPVSYTFFQSQSVHMQILSRCLLSGWDQPWVKRFRHTRLDFDHLDQMRNPHQNFALTELPAVRHLASAPKDRMWVSWHARCQNSLHSIQNQEVASLAHIQKYLFLPQFSIPDHFRQYLTLWYWIWTWPFLIQSILVYPTTVIFSCQPQ